MTYEVGQSAELTVVFTDVNGNPADPTTVVLVVRAPDGTQTTYSSTSRTGVGTYLQVINVAMAGIYSYQWTGTGALNTVIEGSITCAVSLLQGTRPNAIDLTTLDAVKDELAIPGDNTQSDLKLASMITAASLFWMNETARMPSDGTIPTVSPFVQVCSFDEWYDGSGSQVQFVRNPPIRSITSLSIDGTAVAPSAGPTSAGYTIAYNGAAVALRGGGTISSRYLRGIWCGVFGNGIQNVNIKYSAGYSGVPADVSRACLRMVCLTFRSKGWIGQKSQALAQGGGTVTYTDWAMEPWVKAVIKNYTRKAIV